MSNGGVEMVITPQDKGNKHQQSLSKIVLSTLGLSVLLALSACSGGDNKPADAPTTSTSDTADTTTIATDTPVAESEAVTAEPVVEAAPTETPAAPADTTEAPAVESEVLAADAGVKLYDAQCKVCHEKGLLNAPKHGDKAAWAPRLTQDRETLYTHSAKGFNKMPAQAVNGASEAQVKAAVDYMIEDVS